MNNRPILAILVFVLTLTVNPGWAQRAPVPVVLADAKLMPFSRSVQLPGTVVAARTAKLSSSIGGLVKQVSVDFGDAVNAGDTIVELDGEQATFELAQAQAAVQEAQADLNEKQRQLRVGRSLNRRGVITKNQADSRRADVLIAQAVVKKLRAVQAQKSQQLERHRIVAPFAGVIAYKMVEAGEWVSPGTPIVELITNQDVLVDVSLPQKYYSQVSDTTKISVTFDALAGQSVVGQRAALSPVSDPTMRTFKLRVRLQTDTGKPAPGIAPGMSAQVTLTLGSNERSTVIPRDAVVRQADGRTTVWVATPIPGEPGLATVAEKTVGIGNTFDENIVVLTGLQPSDRVVVSGNESLRAKQKVRISVSNARAKKNTVSND